MGGGDGGLEEDTGALDGLPCFGLHTWWMTAEEDLFPDTNLFDIQPRSGLSQDVQGSIHDLGADAVASGDSDCGVGHVVDCGTSRVNFSR